MEVKHLSELSGLREDQVRRAIEWLLQKGLVEKREVPSETKIEIKDRPAELKLVEKVRELGGRAKLDVVWSFLPQEEFSAGLGRAKAKGWVEIANQDGPSIILKDSSDYTKFIESFKRIAS